jgi:hypothetical protein
MALFKKTILTLLLIVPFLYTGTALLNAYDGTGIVESNPDSDWHGMDIYHYMVGDERAYIHFAIPAFNGVDYIATYQSDTDHSIIYYNTPQFDDYIHNPNPEIYNTFVIESVDSNNNYTVLHSSLEDKYDVLRFKLDSQKSYFSMYYEDSTSSPFLKKLYDFSPGIKYRMYWTVSNTIPELSIDDLPLTSGNPYDTNGTYGNVTFETNQNYLDISVYYDAVIYNLKRQLVDDISIFQNVKRANYYTVDNEKFITFTYLERDPVFLQSVNTNAHEWVDTLTWNLTTNEIRSINKVEVYAYHDIDSNRNIYTYMYLPNMIYDDIISVTAGFQYQYEYYIGGKGEEQTEMMTLNVGEKNTFSPKWEKNLLQHVINPMKTGYVLGSKFYGLFGLNIPDPFMKSIDQIQKITSPSEALKTKITTAWNEKYESNIIIDEQTTKLYRLNWGQYDKFGVKKVNMIDGSFSFSEIVFVKDGKVSFLDFDDIILKDVIDDSLVPSPDFNFWEFIIDMFTKYPIPAISVSIILVILLLFTLSPFIQVFVITMSIIKMMIQFALTMALKPFFWIIASIIVVLLLIL